MKEKFTSRIYARKKVHLRIETGGQESDGGKTVSRIYIYIYIYIYTIYERDKKREKSREYM